MALDTESMGEARVWGHVVSLVRLFPGSTLLCGSMEDWAGYFAE